MNRYLTPWIMWFFPLTFFAFQFILRLFPSLVMPEFFARYDITATDFGVFASLYYLGYAGMQIPVALLLDKYGPRLIVSASALLCAFAVWLLLAFDAWPVALLSRFLIGVGSVVGFLGCSKVISQWFKPVYYARIVGLTFSFGLLGAVYGGKPTSHLISNMGWENVLMLLGVIGAVIGGCVFLFVKNKPEETTETPLSVKASLLSLLKNKTLLILAFSNLLMVGCLEGFADVWGVPYLMAANGFSKSQAAGITSFVFVGMLFGGPLLAYLSDKFNAHYNVTALSGVLMAMLLGGFIYFNSALTTTMMGAIMFVIGLLCCYQVIVFAIGAKLVPGNQISLTIAFLNCINMLGGTFFHSSIGVLMDTFEKTPLAGEYSVGAYSAALMLIPIASLIGAIGIKWSQKAATPPLITEKTGKLGVLNTQ